MISWGRLAWISQVATGLWTPYVIAQLMPIKMWSSVLPSQKCHAHSTIQIIRIYVYSNVKMKDFGNLPECASTKHGQPGQYLRLPRECSFSCCKETGLRLILPDRSTEHSDHRQSQRRDTQITAYFAPSASVRGGNLS